MYLFLVSIKDQPNKLDSEVSQCSINSEAPSPRSHCGIAFKHNTIYVYGGIVEKGSKSLTFKDFYSLGKLQYIILLYVQIMYYFSL